MLTAVWGIAWTLRFEGLDWLNSSWREAASYHLLLAVPLWLGIMAAFRLYRRVWSMASIEELKAMMAAVFVAAAAFYKKLKTYIFEQTNSTYDFSAQGIPTCGPTPAPNEVCVFSQIGSFKQQLNGEGGTLSPRKKILRCRLRWPGIEVHS